jgi:tripartite-type tricarboxylate transporter receptor subunit TctC
MAVAAATTVNAETWPSRPIKLIVPTGPGASTDIIARLLAEAVSRSLGQTIYVENKPGAYGILAHETAARAAPDGYTLLFTNTAGVAINLISFKHLPYDPARDFTAIATVIDLGPQVLAVNAGLPVSSVSELIAYAKANRGKLSIAFDSTAGAAAYAAKLFNKHADVGMIEVPYRSASQTVQDVASGVIQVLIASPAAAVAVFDAGKVRPLAVTTSKRFPGLPDLPSLNETVPGIVIDGFFAILAPTGTPPDVIARLNREIDRYLQGPEVEPRFLTLGVSTSGAGSPESTAQAMRDVQEQWRAIAKDLNVEPQ